MKTKRSIKKELQSVERLLCRFHKGMYLKSALKRGKCKLEQRDKDILYGAAQAIGWILEENYMKPSRVVTISEDNT